MLRLSAICALVCGIFSTAAHSEVLKYPYCSTIDVVNGIIVDFLGDKLEWAGVAFGPSNSPSLDQKSDFWDKDLSVRANLMQQMFLLNSPAEFYNRLQGMSQEKADALYNDTWKLFGINLVQFGLYYKRLTVWTDPARTKSFLVESFYDRSKTWSGTSRPPTDKVCIIQSFEKIYRQGASDDAVRADLTAARSSDSSSACGAGLPDRPCVPTDSLINQISEKTLDVLVYLSGGRHEIILEDKKGVVSFYSIIGSSAILMDQGLGVRIPAPNK